MLHFLHTLILPKDGSDVLDCQDFEKMETNVQSRAGLDGRGSDTRARGKDEPAAEDWMGHEGMFRLRIVGCSAFGPRLYLRGDTSK